MYAPYNLRSGFLCVAGLAVHFQRTYCKNGVYRRLPGCACRALWRRASCSLKRSGTVQLATHRDPSAAPRHRWRRALPLPFVSQAVLVWQVCIPPPVQVPGEVAAVPKAWRWLMLAKSFS